MSSSLRAVSLLAAIAVPIASFAQNGTRASARDFSAARLVAPPTTNWPTNGGNLYNQRYSPLASINRDNVANLKGVWRARLRGSGVAPKYSGEGQPVVYDGTVYMSTGANDVFALSLDTGEILWQYVGNVDPNITSVCCGWNNRGVAVSEDKVFMGRLDSRLVALDRKTGEEVWSVQAERWEENFSITPAPVYYDGMVITGFAGADRGTRGRVKAYDSDDGKLLWTFYTIPGPGEPGHDTWPQDNDSWKHGGGAVWQTPAIDPELGLVYFSTGNAGPDYNGAVRAGDNLYTVSIVAVELKTGRYRWHFQQVHHDIWDYDSPNPIVLFDAEIDGRTRRGLVQVSKTGWAYILDRATGEPLIGIEERAVRQEARQATAATQPYPIGDAIVPQSIDIPPEDVPLIQGQGRIVNDGRIFTPFWTEPIALKPGTMGGANWPPSSYDPETDWLYVCASDRINAFVVDPELGEPEANRVYMGGRFTQSQADDRGIFAALDLTTNRLVWRQQWREICYSGSIVTAGGLLFVGRSDGRLTALDKSNGAKLWEFQTDAGVNSTVTTFEHKGEQYVVVHAGGGVFANATRGDGIWMFSLTGTMRSLPTAGAGFGGPPFGRQTPVDDRPGNAELGRGLYLEACVACHGEAGDGGHGGGPTLVAGLSAEQIAAVSSAGRNTMPAFGRIYDAADLRDISSYIVEVLAAE